MKVYIAAPYSARFDLRSLDATLYAAGHETTSRWIWNVEEEKTSQAAAARMDVLDVRRADVLMFIARPIDVVSR